MLRSPLEAALDNTGAQKFKKFFPPTARRGRVLSRHACGPALMQEQTNQTQCPCGYTAIQGQSNDRHQPVIPRSAHTLLFPPQSKRPIGPRFSHTCWSPHSATTLAMHASAKPQVEQPAHARLRRQSGQETTGASKRA